jgi:hypothetical protein
MRPESGRKEAPPLHPAEEAWRRVRARAGEIERVDALQRSRKASVYRLVGLGAPPVIAKRYVDRGAMFERMIYEDVLCPAGISRLGFYGALADDGEGGSWSFTEDAGGVPFSLDDEEHRREVASWLGELHGGAVALVASKPPGNQWGMHEERLAFTGTALARARTEGTLSREGELGYAVRVLDSVRSVSEIIERVLSAGPATLVHGDFGPKNVRLRSEGSGRRVVAYDWEMAVVGRPAVDLWWLGREPDSNALEVYRASGEAFWRKVPLDQLLSYARVGFALRLVDSIYWSLWNLQWQIDAVVHWSRDLEETVGAIRSRTPFVWSRGGA